MNAPPDKRAQAEALTAALNARDFDALADMPFDPAVELRSLIAAAEGGVYYGIQGIRNWAESVDSIFDDFRLELVDFREVDDDRASLGVQLKAKAKTSGLPVDARVGQVWTWRKGLMWRNDIYRDYREALEAVGLGE